MIIVTVDYLPNDDRKFCAKWRACRVDKFSEDKIGINQYAYKDKDIPEDFWKKHTIYYVDTKNENRLTKAYDLEDKWDDMEFTGDNFKLGVAGEITADVLLQYLINLVTTLNEKQEITDCTLETLSDRINNNQITINDIGIKVDNNKNEINGIHTTIDEMQDAISFRATKEELDNATSELRNSISALNNRVTSTHEDLTGQINELDNTITNKLDTLSNSTTAAINDLSNRISALETNAVMNNDTVTIFDEE